MDRPLTDQHKTLLDLVTLDRMLPMRDHAAMYEATVQAGMGLSETRMWQMLNALADNPAAEAYNAEAVGWIKARKEWTSTPRTRRRPAPALPSCESAA